MTAILEDDHGFLWVGTKNGLNRFDGISYAVYGSYRSDENSLSNGYVEDLFEDEEGIIWIATREGINTYDRQKDRIKRFNQDSSLSQKFVSHIYKAGETLWIGTHQEGLLAYDLKSSILKSVSLPYVEGFEDNNLYISEIQSFNGEQLLIFTLAGVHLINPGTGEVIASEFTYRNVSSGTTKPGGEIWYSTYNGGLVRTTFDGSKFSTPKKIQLTKGHAALSIATSSEGNIWVGSENDGLFIFNPTNETHDLYLNDPGTPNSLNSSSIWTLLAGKNQVMWIGTFHKGLSFHDPNYHKFTHFSNNPYKNTSLSNNHVNAFMEDEKGNFWIGTDGGGLNYWDVGNRKFSRYRYNSRDKSTISSDAVLAFTEDPDGKIWMATWAGGVCILDPKTKKIQRLNTRNSFLSTNNLFSILADSDGNIWAGNFLGGLDFYNPETGESKSYLYGKDNTGLTANTITSLEEGKNGLIWIGTEADGLFSLKRIADGTIEAHQYTSDPSLPNTISDNFIYSIYQDPAGPIWVGTGGGLNKINAQNGSIQYYGRPLGFQNEAIKSIIKDNNGKLWLGTNHGLVVYDPVSQEVINYNKADGLQGLEFNAGASYLSKSGKLLFGGTDGFNLIDPENISVNQLPPPVYLTGLKIFNTEVQPGDEFDILSNHISQTKELNLSYKHSVISFDFVALNFRHPSENQYAYYLEGFEKDWNYVGSINSCTYTNLNPGNYILHVKASNNDGVWNEEGISVMVTITPPFWASLWFKIILGIFFSGLIYGLYVLRLRRIRAHQKYLEKLIKERTTELEDQKKQLLEVANLLSNANEQVNIKNDKLEAQKKQLLEVANLLSNANEQVHLKNDELSIKNEEIQRFTYAVSHDLKSPLSTIKGFAGVIDDDLDAGDYSEIKDHLKYITTSCDSMKSLIEDITEIAKLGKVDNNVEKLNTNEIAELAGVLVKGKLNKKKANLIIQDHLPPINGDKKRIMQVFENLIDNAIKYMGEQLHPVIEVGYKNNSSDNYFFVKDNGTGIDVEGQAKIFQPFERLDKSVEGTGLGLPMIQKVIESHGGKLWVESEGHGKGSTFFFSMPKVSS